MVLGVFDDAKLASDAYFAAKAVFKDQQYSRDREGRKPQEVRTAASKARAAPAADGESEDEAEEGADATVANPTARSSKYRGVIREGEGITMWEAVIHANGRDISGGEYETEEEAAKAYDALARMYQGADAVTNFPVDTYTAWVPPDSVLSTGQIETKLGVPLTVDEIVDALNQERGVDVAALSLAGRSDLAEHMIFVTGKSVAHMRKMADMLSRAVRYVCRHHPDLQCMPCPATIPQCCRALGVRSPNAVSMRW